MTAAPMTTPDVDERVSRPGRRRPRRHAEDPGEPGRALCGARLPLDRIRTGDGECPLCQAIVAAGRSWISR